MRIEDLHAYRACPLHPERRIATVDFRAKSWRCAPCTEGFLSGILIRHDEDELTQHPAGAGRGQA